MVLLLLALAFLFISTFFVYKTAKENGYNAILWSVLSFFTFVGVYLVLSVTIVLIIGIGIRFLGWSPNLLDQGGMMIELLVMATSAACVMLILRHVNQLKDDEPFVGEIPPPPDFGG
jgi:cytochrome bd-type quinol oxidase subunit 2